MKQLVKNYTFNASTRKITFTDFASIDIERVLLVTNVEANFNKIIYNFADITKGGYVTTGSPNILTLVFDTSSMANGDNLEIFYDYDISQGASVLADGAPIGGETRITNRSVTADGTHTRAIFDSMGRLLVKQGNVRQLTDVNTVTLTDISETTLIPAVSGVFHIIESLVIAAIASGTQTLELRDSSGGTVRKTIRILADTTVTLPVGNLPQSTANNNWTVKLLSSPGAGSVVVSVISHRDI